MIKKKKENINYQYQEWIRGYHYRSYRHNKDNKEILQATSCQ